MIAGGNWWRANEIVIRYHIRQTDPRNGSCDKTTQRSSRPQKWVPTFDLSDRGALETGANRRVCIVREVPPRTNGDWNFAENEFVSGVIPNK